MVKPVQFTANQIGISFKTWWIVQNATFFATTHQALVNKPTSQASKVKIAFETLKKETRGLSTWSIHKWWHLIRKDTWRLEFIIKSSLPLSLSKYRHAKGETRRHGAGNPTRALFLYAEWEWVNCQPKSPNVHLAVYLLSQVYKLGSSDSLSK